MLDVGTIAPDFKLLDQNQQEHHLSQYRGKWVVIYFYPKDNTPGCTTEACTIRDHWKDLSHKAIVLGISTDSVNSHSKFAKKYTLLFPILADTTKEVVNAYQVWVHKKFMGREFLGTLRVTYIVNPDGVIAYVYKKVKPADHAEELAHDLSELQKV